MHSFEKDGSRELLKLLQFYSTKKKKKALTVFLIGVLPSYLPILYRKGKKL